MIGGHDVSLFLLQFAGPVNLYLLDLNLLHNWLFYISIKLKIGEKH